MRINVIKLKTSRMIIGGNFMDNSTIRKELIRLTWPLFIQTILFMVLGMVDTLMLSRYSDNAVAAVSVSNQVLNFVQILFAVISVGTSILCAQYKGAQDEKNVGIVASVSLLFNAVMGIIFSVVLVVCSRSIFKLMNVPQEIMEYAVQYLVIVGAGSVFQALLNTTGAIVTSTGHTKVAMNISVTVNVINIVGNYILIFGAFGFPAMGVRGAAISTTLSKAIMSVFAIILLVVKINKNISIKALVPFPFEILKKILKIGIPSAGENLAYNISQLVITSIISTMGSLMLTARAYIGNITMFTIAFSSAIGQGTSILVGNKIGAKQKDDAYKACMYSLKVGIVTSLIVSSICAVFSGYLVGIFTTNKEILSVAAIVLAFDIILEIGRVFNVIIIDSLKAAGDVKFPVFWGVISMWGISVVLSYVLGLKMNLALLGVWIACAADEWFRGILMLVRWKKGKWRKMKLI